MRRAMREHVWHSDRSPEEQRAFRQHVADATRRFVTIAAVVATAVSVVSWPMDYVAFRDRGSPELLWHITEWRLIVIGLSIALWIELRVLPRHVVACVSASTLVALALLGVSVGKVGRVADLHVNFVYTFYLLPPFGILLFVPILQRVALTFAIPVVSMGAYLAVDREFLHHPFLPTVFAVLACSCALSILIGHLFYDLVRVNYFRGKALEQERVTSERYLQRLVEHTTAELQRHVAERSQDVGDVLAKLAQQASEPLEAGRVIDGRYRVIRPLGKGGVGAVHEVERLADSAHFALKTLHGNVQTEAMARFAREAGIAARLNHANLVPVIDFGVTRGGLFLVMELVEGGSLEDARDRFGDPAWALPILCEVAAGLSAMHELDIIHRDLKPDNILISGARVRIADFGLASLHADQVADVANARLTHAGEVFGTFDYMAPELAAGSRAASPASDVFAFGVMAYEMTYGDKPFAEPPIFLRLGDKPVEARPGHGALWPIVSRCLAAEPARRPTASTVRTELRSIRLAPSDIARGTATRSSPTSRLRPTRGSS